MKNILLLNQSPFESAVKSINDFLSKSHEKKDKLIVITGPTTSGKTALSLKVAKYFKGEIISADSRQVYKGLNIGTNKITNAQDVIYRGEKSLLDKNIPHFMIDIKNPEEDFSVSEFVNMSRRIISKIYDDHKLPIIVGGTGYYIYNLIENKSFEEYTITSDTDLQVETMDYSEKLNKLKEIDPEILKYIDIKNERRFQSPLKYYFATGRKYSDYYLSKSIPLYDVLILRIEKDLDELYESADKKLLQRFDEGMIEEVRSLMDKGVSVKWLQSIGLEYRYISLYLEGKLHFHEMKERLRLEIHHYIKRQKTYIKKYL